MTMTAFDMAAVQARMEKYKAEWYELPPHFYEQKIIADLTAALTEIERLATMNRELEELKRTIWENPDKWVRWCDHKLLEQLEQLQAELRHETKAAYQHGNEDGFKEGRDDERQRD